MHVREDGGMEKFGVTEKRGVLVISHIAEGRSGDFIPDLIQRVCNFVKKKLFG